MDAALAKWLAVEDSSDDISVVVASTCFDDPDEYMEHFKPEEVDANHAVHVEICQSSPSIVREVLTLAEATCI